MHPDLIYVHSNALREGRADFIRSVSSGKIRYLSFERKKMEVEQWRKTAIVNGEVLVKGQYNGNAFDLNLRYLAVYRKVKKNWILYRWQSTKQ
jgi:ketosteroid isomerase-like protein